MLEGNVTAAEKAESDLSGTVHRTSIVAVLALILVCQVVPSEDFNTLQNYGSTLVQPTTITHQHPNHSSVRCRSTFLFQLLM